VDQLDKAGIWQDSSSPPRRLVLSPSVPQVSSPRPSALTRLGDPPNILERLSAVLHRHTPVISPISSHMVAEPPIQVTTSIMELDQQLLDAVNDENYHIHDGNECSIVGDGYDSDLYVDHADNPGEKEHGVNHHNISNDAGYGTLMLLTEVAFDMPEEPMEPMAEPEAPVPIDSPHQLSHGRVPWV
jgi:hypothetical protein